jgi:hypothetical protein
MIFRFARAGFGCAFATLAVGAAEPSRGEVEQSLLRAAKFFREEVSIQGTYLWQYSADLSKREGEARAAKAQGWVQPPGTPSIGLAYLRAWQTTTNRYFLEAARETAYALIRGQLASGGWQHSLELDPELRKKIAYRESGSKNGRNITTFDDDTTQAALRFLMRTDAALQFADKKIHEAVQYALGSILKAQYPNGSWAQGYQDFPAPDKFPAIKARFPSEWSRTWPNTPYSSLYTLNDNNLATLVETLFEASRVYAGPSDPLFSALAENARHAAARVGDFLILAQMPEPQPAWAQQYNFEMHPAWARKFEPPAISGGESHGALRTLLQIYRETGDKKYLEPIPKALAYLRKSRLPDGRLARFYELRTNRPLYFTREYQLTYDDSDLPTHYAFKISDQTDAISTDYEQIRSLPQDQLMPPMRAVNRPSAEEVQKMIATLDDRGRWIETGRLRYHGADDPTTEIIRSVTFTRNVEALCDYLTSR